MTIDPWREVRDAVRPSAAAGTLPSHRAHAISQRHRVPIEDVERIYGEEHARLHPETAGTTDPDTEVYHCDQCKRLFPSLLALGAHRRDDHAATETAEPDTTVQASAPPAVTEDEPTPPADPERWGMAKDPCGAKLPDVGGSHTCGLPGGHDGDHLCREPESDGDGGYRPCNFRGSRMEDEPAGTVGIDVQWPDETPTPLPAIDWSGEDLAGDVAEPAGWNIVTADAGMAPLTEAEQAQASDMALVSDAVLALAMLDDQCPDSVRQLLAAAQDNVQALHQALRDHHRQADLIAERAVLQSRLAEIDAALGYDDADQVNDQPPPQPEVGGGRVNCPKCGREFYRNGLPRHMAIHKKKRGAA